MDYKVNPHIQLELQDGNVIIELFQDIAPAHCEQILNLISSGFYNGLSWHRVIKGFMAQTGCPNGNGTGGSGKTIKAEFSDLPFEEGTVGMARSMDPDSADSQFFICFGETPHLNGLYTIVGKVISGMEYVHQIKSSTADVEIKDPDILLSAKVLDLDSEQINTSKDIHAFQSANELLKFISKESASVKRQLKELQNKKAFLKEQMDKVESDIQYIENNIEVLLSSIITASKSYTPKD